MHGHLNDGRIKFLSLDLENGGEECGLFSSLLNLCVQSCTAAVRSKTAVKDSLESLERGGDIFDEQNNQQGTVFDG